MTTAYFDQFDIVSEREALHRPTATRITFPRAQPWQGDGYALCSISEGQTDTKLPNGDYFALADVLDAARKLMRTRALAQAS